MVGKYTVKFDINNPNAILVYEGKKLINMFALPPIDKGIDVFNIFNEDMSTKYAYNFGGFVIITTKLDRTLFYKGNIIDTIMKIKLQE